MSEQKTRVLIDQHGHTLRVIDNEFCALQAERDALAAQVGAFAAMIIEVRSADESKDFLGSDWHERSDALIASTPEHHLAANDAKAAKAAFIAGACSFDKDSDLYIGAIEYSAERYAASLNK